MVKKQILVALATVFIISAVVCIGVSFSSLHSTELGLNYNTITQFLDPQPYSAGLHFLGIGHKFIKFPNTYQTMQFSTAEHDVLHTRTSDGLPLTLGISFQYTLIKPKVYHLYMRYSDSYPEVLFDIATHVLADTACNYTAYNFFNDKQSIAVVMQQELNRVTAELLFMNVETLQIMLVKLPETFEDAIVESISVKQNITRTQKTKASKQVMFDTQVMAAHQKANQTVIESRGKAQEIIAQQNATAAALLQNVEAELTAYSEIQKSLNLEVDGLVNYVYYDSLADRQGNAEYVVGLQPNTFIASYH
mmetsp:Transcript_30443/g.59509  ORF Transcript_30443/g.59509 Transcript_30443/m.59509 type:complete len:306 (-) Transcript_30443:21-938(-)